MKKSYLTLALCCGAVALAGCGSSSSSNSGTGVSTGPASAAVFSADLNSLCRQSNGAARKAGINPLKIAALIANVLPKFKALTAPAAQQAIYSKFVANFQKEATALASGNRGAFTTIRGANNALASQLHAPACSAGS